MRKTENKREEIKIREKDEKKGGKSFSIPGGKQKSQTRQVA